ncbi:MAG: protocatechuate 3,4-dioxygenase subunit alpha [Chthoniobacterales bacterium]
MSERATATGILGLAASQTVGPFFQIGLADLYQTDLTVPGLAGTIITISGKILDADRLPVPDALVEIWQANSFGKYAHPDDDQDKPLDPGFTGFGRCPTNAEGAFHFRTVKPGSVPSLSGAAQAPHISVSIFMRGLLNRLVTRIYFSGDERNGADEVLSLVDPARRSTLLARPDPVCPNAYRWEVVLQGPQETVFFDF